MEPLQPRAERMKLGKALRKRVTRESHAGPKGLRDRDAVAILAESDADRVPELVPERYKRMTANPFAFLRGAAAVMASDLADQPMAGIPVQAGGDSHLMNFGAFATPEDNILFDVNDFDETLPGVDFTVDLKRLAASVAVAAVIAAYRGHMLSLAHMSPLEVWHSRIDLETELANIQTKSLRRKISAIIAKARGAGLEKDDNFPNLVSGKEARIADKPPAIFHLDAHGDIKHRIDAERVFALYRQGLSPDRLALVERYEMKDLVFKAVGVGSVGTFCCAGLFMSGDGAPMFLQVKQAWRSALERLGGGLGYAGHQGQRVVEGQRMMQAANDIFLGWTQDDDSGRQFYVRALKNRRLGGVSDIAETEALGDYAALCGRTLARAHARSGDPAMIAGYLGKGAAMDDAPLQEADQDLWLLDQIGNHFAALVYVQDAQAVAAHYAALAQTLAALPIPVELVLLTPQAPGKISGVRVLHDHKGRFAERYDAQAGTCYLLRPDQHVAARWRAADASAIQAALARATLNPR